MKKHALLLIFLCTFSLLPTAPANTAALPQTMTFNDYLQRANAYIRAYRHFEAADALKEATKLGGTKHPSLHMRLAILYYGLGLISEAIIEGEKAVQLTPDSKWYKYDLAKFYYVDKQYGKAQQQFSDLLTIDPGFTFGYYFLAELFFHQKLYDMAWLSYERAKLLGHRGKHLQEKLAPYTTKPRENFNQQPDDKLFRFIKVPSQEKAEEILTKIRNGKLFENLELELKKERNGDYDFGTMMLGELKDSVALSLKDNRPYATPVIIQTGPDYRIMQRVLPFDIQAWKTILKNAASRSAAEKMNRKPTGDENFSAKITAFYALEHWRNVWESADVKAYFAAYSKNFSPQKGVSLQSWRQKSRKNLTTPTFIRIQIDDPIVEMLTKNRMLVTFEQSYTSNTYHSVVLKALTMEKEAEGWKIIQEQILQKIGS